MTLGSKTKDGSILRSFTGRQNDEGITDGYKRGGRTAAARKFPDYDMDC